MRMDEKRKRRICSQKFCYLRKKVSTHPMIHFSERERERKEEDDYEEEEEGDEGEVTERKRIF